MIRKLSNNQIDYIIDDNYYEIRKNEVLFKDKRVEQIIEEIFEILDVKDNYYKIMNNTFDILDPIQKRNVIKSDYFSALEVSFITIMKPIMKKDLTLRTSETWVAYIKHYQSPFWPLHFACFL